MAFWHWAGSQFPLLCVLILLQSLIVHSTVNYVSITNDHDEAILVPDNRRPALYTKDFGDCLGHSAINVTRFDAAYYRDNMTVLFHLEGNTNVVNDSVMSEWIVLALNDSG